MRRAMGVFVVLFLLAMSVPATAAMYNISVTPSGDRVNYRSWYRGGADVWSDVSASPNLVYHDYYDGSGNSANATVSFNLASFVVPATEIISASFNFNIVDIWTQGRDDVANLDNVGTVYASGGTGWKSFDVTESLRAALAGNPTSIGYNFSYTGYSGFTFSSAEGGQPAFLSITTADASPVPVPPAVWLFGPGLVGLLRIKRKFKK